MAVKDMVRVGVSKLVVALPILTENNGFLLQFRSAGLKLIRRIDLEEQINIELLLDCSLRCTV
jgi:hypothetical protein